MNKQTQEEIEEILKGNYACDRVWSAWEVGTMSEEDFRPLEEDSEVVDAILKIIEEEKIKVYKDLLALRTPYVYDDYSTLYQQSGKIWTEYAQVENDFLVKKIRKLEEK